jgi:DNA-binding transcriptional MerR regulator
MASSLAIGDFSRATHLTIKTLRHYRRIGLLEPAAVDPFTGHRHYTTDQIPTAQVIRRFRSLDMPLEEIHAVITTPDLATRNQLISTHLQHIEMTLARTQQAAASLRAILEPPTDAAPVAIEHRRMPDTPAAAVSEVIDVKDASAWYQGAVQVPAGCWRWRWSCKSTSTWLPSPISATSRAGGWWCATGTPGPARSRPRRAPWRSAPRG